MTATRATLLSQWARAQSIVGSTCNARVLERMMQNNRTCTFFCCEGRAFVFYCGRPALGREGRNVRPESWMWNRNARKYYTRVRFRAKIRKFRARARVRVKIQQRSRRKSASLRENMRTLNAFKSQSLIRVETPKPKPEDLGGHEHGSTQAPGRF